MKANAVSIAFKVSSLSEIVFELKLGDSRFEISDGKSGWDKRKELHSWSNDLNSNSIDSCWNDEALLSVKAGHFPVFAAMIKFSTIESSHFVFKW